MPAHHSPKSRCRTSHTLRITAPDALRATRHHLPVLAPPASPLLDFPSPALSMRVANPEPLNTQKEPWTHLPRVSSFSAIQESPPSGAHCSTAASFTQEDPRAAGRVTLCHSPAATGRHNTNREITSLLSFPHWRQHHLFMKGKPFITPRTDDDCLAVNWRTFPLVLLAALLSA